jgi:outer membrane protein TolC
VPLQALLNLYQALGGGWHLGDTRQEKAP